MKFGTETTCDCTKRCPNNSDNVNTHQHLYLSSSFYFLVKFHTASTDVINLGVSTVDSER